MLKIFLFVFHQNWFQNQRVKQKRLNSRAPVIPNSNTIITSASSASKINECADVLISGQRNQSNHPLDVYHVTTNFYGLNPGGSFANSKINECADVLISGQGNQSNHPLDVYHVTTNFYELNPGGSFANSKINECADILISGQGNQSNHPLDRYHVTTNFYGLNPGGFFADGHWCDFY